MADDRALESPEEAIGRLDGKLADLESTLLARMLRRPTGDIEPSIRGVAKPGTLVLAGQLESRENYAGLWAWAQAQGLVVSGLFTVGNGSTTFGLPDFRGRVLHGASGVAPGTLSGADSKTIAATNLPIHDHNVSVTVNDHAAHGHTGDAGPWGNHGGHGSGGAVLVPEGSFYGVLPGQPQDSGHHGHSVTVNNASVSSHVENVTEQTFGSATPTPLDVRQAGIAVHWLIWT